MLISTFVIIANAPDMTRQFEDWRRRQRPRIVCTWLIHFLSNCSLRLNEIKYARIFFCTSIQAIYLIRKKRSFFLAPFTCRVASLGIYINIVVVYTNMRCQMALVTLFIAFFGLHGNFFPPFVSSRISPMYTVTGHFFLYPDAIYTVVL